MKIIFKQIRGKITQKSHIFDYNKYPNYSEYIRKYYLIFEYIPKSTFGIPQPEYLFGENYSNIFECHYPSAMSKRMK